MDVVDLERLDEPCSSLFDEEVDELKRMGFVYFIVPLFRVQHCIVICYINNKMKGIILLFLKWMDMRLRSLLGWPTPPDHIKSGLNSEV